MGRLLERLLDAVDEGGSRGVAAWCLVLLGVIMAIGVVAAAFIGYLYAWFAWPAYSSVALVVVSAALITYALGGQE